MIGIGLMGFLLAGIALLLSTMNVLENGQRYVREITMGPQLVFEQRNDAKAKDTHRAAFARATPNHPVLLSGLPAYQSVAFSLPLDARPTSGYLQIDATSQILNGVEGVLRISIRNTRRGEMLLRPGEAERSLQLPLSPMDFARHQLVVSFSLQGTSPSVPCGPDDGIAAIVEIETTSALFLTLDQPLQTPRDRISSWGQTARIAWSDSASGTDQARLLGQAVAFQRRGIAPVFVPGGGSDTLATDAVDATLASLAPTAIEPTLWPRPLAGTRATGGTRRFHKQTVWRETFELSAAQGDAYARALDLNLTLGVLMAPSMWTVSVTLNDRLVHQAHVAAGDTQLSTQIELPRDVQERSNEIEVTLSTTDHFDGTCNEGPERIAELLPSTVLLASDTAFADDSTDMRAALAALDVTQIAVAGALTAPDATLAVQLLDDVLPPEAAWQAALNAADILVVPAGTPLAATLQSGWVVTWGEAGINVIPLDRADRAGLGTLALVVFSTPISLTEVAS